jgi:hypothetical protein
MFAVLEKIDPEYFKAIREKGTLLENAIGDYTFEIEMRDFVKEDPELSKLLTPKIEAMFSGRIVSNRDRLLENMRRWQWIDGDGAYRDILKLVEKSEPITKKSFLKKKLLKSMAKELENIHEEILSGALNPNEIEAGIHKMRRLLRKILIVVREFEGMFYLSDALKVTGVTVRDKIANDPKYLLNEKDLLKRAVPISKDGFLFINQLVKDFAKLKGNDGMKEYIYSAVKRADLGDEAKPLLEAVDPKGAAAGSFKKTRADAKALFQLMTDSKFLLQLADQFREAAREFE